MHLSNHTMHTEIQIASYTRPEWGEEVSFWENKNTLTWIHQIFPLMEGISKIGVWLSLFPVPQQPPSNIAPGRQKIPKNNLRGGTMRPAAGGGIGEKHSFCPQNSSIGPNPTYPILPTILEKVWKIKQFKNHRVTLFTSNIQDLEKFSSFIIEMKQHVLSTQFNYERDTG